MLAGSPSAWGQNGDRRLIKSISKVTLRRNRDGRSTRSNPRQRHPPANRQQPHAFSPQSGGERAESAQDAVSACA